MSEHQAEQGVNDPWADGPDDELVPLGREMFAMDLRLPQIALDRIQVRMRQEMTRVARRRRVRAVVLVGLTCVAITVALWGRLHAPGRRANVPGAGGPTDYPSVRDRFEVTIPPSSPKAPEKPLVDLDEYKDLFDKPKGATR